MAEYIDRKLKLKRKQWLKVMKSIQEGKNLYYHNNPQSVKRYIQTVAHHHNKITLKVAP